MGMLGKILDGFGEFADQSFKTAQLLGLLRMDRQTALQHVQLAVESKTAEQLDAYENDFLNFYGQLLLPSQRVRAMELYAWLKISEAYRYNAFRGFVGKGEPVM